MSRLSITFVLAALWLLAAWPSRAMATPPAEDVLPPLPEAINNFGAAELDGFVYLYGGHQGSEQDQIGKNLSQHFIRCDLNSPTKWHALPLDKPLQDLSLVSCNKTLYRIGGAASADTELPLGPLRSVSDVVRFDPSTNEWTPVASLPTPRSAHDAIAFEGRIYVVGGWNHEGDKVNDWHDSALMLDTNDGDQAKWQSLPIPSFRRRTLAVAAWQNCIWAIGGKDDEGTIHRSVFCYDPQRSYWSEGPELPARADGLQGYGVAAWGLDSGLYVSGADGALYRLASMYGNWEQVGELRVQRFCHRLLPEDETSLFALAGSSVSYGPTRSIERIKVYSP